MALQMNQDKISLKNVCFRYAGTEEHVLKEINLSIKHGEFLVLTGNSGCGKSSLLRLINGLIPHFFEGYLRGTVQIDGRNTSEMSIGEIGKQVSSIFQDTKSQFFTTNTESEIVFAAQNYGVPKDIMKDRINTIYQELNLQDIWQKNIFSLSSGQRQKTAFAGAEILNPDIYVLDEPSANLDMEAILQLRGRLLLLKESGKTIVVAEHRLFYLSGLADRIILLKEGKLIAESLHDLKDLAAYYRKGLRCMDINNMVYQNPTYQPLKPFLEFSGIRHAYDGHPLLHNVSAALSAGEIITVIGVNGAGKTTLCKLLAGLLKSQKGTFTVDGKRVKPSEMYRYSFFVMQETDYQLFTESCIRELTLGLPQTESNIKNARDTLGGLSMGEFCDVHPQSLSGGQKQRVVVASAIYAEKPIVILDEPTSGLDEANMRAIATVLQHEARKGKVVIVITHDMELMACISQRVLEITRNGTLVERKISSPADFYQLCHYMLGGYHEI